jgi:hypothetical protein
MFIAGYFYFNKPQPLQFRGVEGLHIITISPETKEIQGQLVFYNPNKMRAQLGSLDFDVAMNAITIGKLHERFSTAVKGEEEFHFDFQIRFPITEVIPDTAAKDYPVSIAGRAGSDVLMSNYTFPIQWEGVVKAQ